MKFILLLLIAGAAIYLIYLYFSNEQVKLKHNLILVTQYNEKLKKELCMNKSKNICAKFSTPLNTYGILNEGIQIYIAPLENSSVINSIKEEMQVDILDECTLSDVTWFYINLPLDSDVNCHGWVKKCNFSMLCSNKNEITPTSSE